MSPSYANRPANGPGLLYGSWGPHGALQLSDRFKKCQIAHIVTDVYTQSGSHTSVAGRQLFTIINLVRHINSLLMMQHSNIINTEQAQVVTKNTKLSLHFRGCSVVVILN